MPMMMAIVTHLRLSITSTRMTLAQSLLVMKMTMMRQISLER